MMAKESQTALSLARLTALVSDQGLEQPRASRLLRQLQDPAALEHPPEETGR